MSVPFLLAPMAELSHRALRELIEGFGGCDTYFTEMISAPGLLSGGPFEPWYMDGAPCPDRVVYQLTGAESGTLAAAAALLDRQECAGIDINMGCSAPAITRTGAGVRWMASLDRAAEMVGRVRKAVKRRLSVKLRLGLTEDFDYLAAFCRRLEAEGVEFITLHPRTGREKFKRRARWEYVEQLRKVLGIPVAGNGDIASAEELLRRAAFPCDAVMAGRLAVKAPWVFAQARRMEAAGSAQAAAPPQVDLEETGLRFLELLARHQPPEFHLSRARRFFAYYCDNFTWGTYLKNLLGREQSLVGMAAVLGTYFRDQPGEKEPSLRKEGPEVPEEAIVPPA
ncbi:tRNA-dihydrouridine synthase [Spirochaetia bacterium]|nr:tRNA-dihydrouridine synthase [Spirochaetia bacterium]